MNIETSIAKVDLDIKLDSELLETWIATRLAILEELRKAIIGIRRKETEHGYHFWFEFLPRATTSELAFIQFCLGDDVLRCKFNFLRDEAGVFHQFNALFSKKHKKERKA